MSQASNSSTCFLAELQQAALLEEMVACTLDYKWHHHVIAALVSLFGGVVILLPFKLVWLVLERRQRQRRRPSTATSLLSTLCHLQSSAEGILAGNSTINKTIVSSLSSSASVGVQCLFFCFTYSLLRSRQCSFSLFIILSNNFIPYHSSMIGLYV